MNRRRGRIRRHLYLIVATNSHRTLLLGQHNIIGVSAFRDVTSSGESWSEMPLIIDSLRIPFSSIPGDLPGEDANRTEGTDATILALSKVSNFRMPVNQSIDRAAKAGRRPYRAVNGPARMLMSAKFQT